jgi:hypothetical protein
MESKKDIGKLFKENLEQLDFTPSDKVWEQIELDLEKKKKKRRFLIWFFFYTVVFGGFLVGLTYTFSGENLIGNTETLQNSGSNEKSIKSNSTIVTKENESKDPNSENTHGSTNENPNNTNSKINLNTAIEKNKTAYTEDSEKSSKNKIKHNRKGINGTFKNKKSNLTYSKNTRKNNQNKSGKSKTKKPDSAETAPAGIANNGNISTTDFEKRISVDSLIASKNEDKKITVKNIKKKDSLPQDTTKVPKEKSKRYEVVIAPYYGLNYNGYFGDFNAISNNTIIEKKGQFSSIYGVIARWMFTEKVGLQLGAGKINNRYFTTIEKNNADFINTQNVETDIPIHEINAVFANSNKVKFTYESSYIEVPLEAYYVLMDKKFGVATSVGVSFLFGGKNTVYAASDTIEKMKIGTLTTALPSSATGNAKLYLFYKITPSLHLDLYPTFQYQFLGDKDSSTYSAYFFSLRAGFSYRL